MSTAAPLADLVARATGARAHAVRVAPRPPLEHQSNRLYDVFVPDKHLIAKEFVKPDERAIAPLREHRALELLAALGVAPRPVLLETSPEPPLGPVVVYEYVEGEMWDRRQPTRAQLAALAQAWLAMHHVPVEGVLPSRGHERTIADLEPWFRESLRLYDEWARVAFPPGLRGLDLLLGSLDARRPVAAELADHDPVCCFCRADPRFANVIQRPDGRLAMIDWEDSGLRDPAKDVAGLALHANQEDLLTPDDLRAFLVPYLAERAPLDPHLARRIDLYRAGFPLFWLAGFLRGGIRRAQAGQLRGWRINTMPANERLRRYLARALAWPAEDFAEQYEALGELAFFPTA